MNNEKSMLIIKGADLPFETWLYEDQTKKKHLVLQEYLDLWIKIVGKYYKLNYIDGFGGIGAYRDKDGAIYFGSPILVAESIEKNLRKLQRAVNIVIIDKDKKNLENLKKIFMSLHIKIKPIFISGDFDAEINRILDNVSNLAPTFFFIDPFGFKIKYTTLKRIMSIEKSEILLNFMHTRINQFLSYDKLEESFNELFGCSDWKKCLNLSKEKRELEIVECIRSQFKKFAKYVFYFRLEFPDKKRTYYYLIHLTNHYLGCMLMKSCFAKHNFGRVEYRGNRSGQLEIYDSENIIVKEAEEYLKKKFQSKQISFKGIMALTADETKFLESHLRKAIRNLEVDKAKFVTISRIPPKTKSGKERISIQKNDIISFF